MGICGEYSQNKDVENSNSKKEAYIGYKPISISTALKVMKSVCRIFIGKNCGTGFFIKKCDSQKYLITNYHLVSQDKINQGFEIEIYNHKKFKLNLNNRNIKYFPNPTDITIIEIKNNDEIYKEIEFLEYALDNKNGYKIYKDANIFSIEEPNTEKVSYSSGKIINIKGFEFEHNIASYKGSSGCPIILLDTNNDLPQVIGINKEINISTKLTTGIFIDEIFGEENNDLNKSFKNKINNNKNYILAEIDIFFDDINKDIRIINSYEENQRKEKSNKKLEEQFMNEEEIKKCEIVINGESIPFNYFFKFPKKGRYIIKYSFNNYLTKINHMFAWCFSLKSISLSDFNAQNITDMSWMFSGCILLKNINLSNFNSQNVNNMRGLFDGCSSLSFINLSNFNTQNVTDMKGMFYGCSSLTNIDLSNFNTQNVTNMDFMFFDCWSLKNINLSNFNAQKIIKMSHMFDGCLSLTNINLSNFNPQNVQDMSEMFKGCKSLRKENLITKEKRILDEFNKENEILK